MAKSTVARGFFRGGGAPPNKFRRGWCHEKRAEQETARERVITLGFTVNEQADMTKSTLRGASPTGGRLRPKRTYKVSGFCFGSKVLAREVF